MSRVCFTQSQNVQNSVAIFDPCRYHFESQQFSRILKQTFSAPMVALSLQNLINFGPTGYVKRKNGWFQV